MPPRAPLGAQRAGQREVLEDRAAYARRVMTAGLAIPAGIDGQQLTVGQGQRGPGLRSASRSGDKRQPGPLQQRLHQAFGAATGRADADRG